MRTATQRLQAIQDECRRQGRPTHGQEFIMLAERMNEALIGKDTTAYFKVREIIQKAQEYIDTTRP
jgi:hypothetical protein